MAVHVGDMTTLDDLARAAAERRHPPLHDTQSKPGVAEALRAAYIEGFHAAAADLGVVFVPGARVFYSGRVINPDWDRAREGTVVAVHQAIDIHWDHNLIDPGQLSSEFTEVGVDPTIAEDQS